MQGVESVESGYVGGQNANPSYEQVCGGPPAMPKSYKSHSIRQSFRSKTFCTCFLIHDPTTFNRQGNDMGTQYRSVNFYHLPEQKAVAEEVMADIAREKIYRDPLVTELKPAPTFNVAEVDHQEYYARNPNQPYCRDGVEPKAAKFRKQFLGKMKQHQGSARP